MMNSGALARRSGEAMKIIVDGVAGRWKVKSLVLPIEAIDDLGSL